MRTAPVPPRDPDEIEGAARSLAWGCLAFLLAFLALCLFLARCT